MFYPWTEITAFHNIRKYTHAYPDLLRGENIVHYKPKVKLHGTNAAVQVHLDGNIIAQSRENIITPEKDNNGFARWVHENKDNWQSAAKGFVFFGEWVGPGVQRGVAVGQIPRKSFVVFAVQPLLSSVKTPPVYDSDDLIVDPEAISKMVSAIPDVYVLPWYNDGIKIDWSLGADILFKETETINQWVASIEANDPWVESVFGIKGTGEGLVFYPVSDKHIGLQNFNNLTFKAKGEKHKNIATAKPAQVNPEAAASIEAFATMVLTLARLEQGATAVGLPYDAKQIGKFIGWIAADIQKETKDEMAASGLDWKQVQKTISDKARTWYLDKVKKS